MLNLFPIQFLDPFAYTILRICVGLIFISLGRSHIKNRASLTHIFTFSFLPYGRFVTWYVAIIEIIIGVLFVLGLFTQAAAVLSIFYSLKLLVMHKKFSHPLIPNRMFLALLLCASLSLLITGGGVLGFDLPI